jgi:pimeloyl-ACP methyl ester carboxylesterase
MRRPRRNGIGRPLALILVLLVAAPLAACGGQAPPTTAPEGSQAVSFTSADGVHLEGRLFGSGRTGVVLSHMYPADQASWWDFAQTLADEGYRALTYDFRGYCPGKAAGCSGGEKDPAEIWQDVLGAIDFLRSRGVRQVMLIGASMGGTSSLIAAAKDQGVDVVVTLSAPTEFEGLTVDADTLSQVTAAKLFIAGVGDGSAADAAQKLYDMSPPPKRVEILTTDDHGTDILTGNQAGPAQTLILNYLAQYAETS